MKMTTGIVMSLLEDCKQKSKTLGKQRTSGLGIWDGDEALLSVISFYRDRASPAARRRARYPTPSKQLVASLWLQWWSFFQKALGWGLLSTFKFYLNFKMQSKVKEHGLVGQSFLWFSPSHFFKGGVCICIHVSVHNKPKPKTCSRGAPTTCWPRLDHRTRL